MNKSNQISGFGSLIGLSLAPVAKWVRRQILQARLRSLQGLAIYFDAQIENAQAGLADTHKRIALARSEINALK